MRELFRIVVTFTSAVFAYLFVYLMTLALLPSGLGAALAGTALSLAAAVLTWRWMWARTAAFPEGLATTVAAGALGLGGLGFVGGFFGPMIVAPDANQGPLLGLFITGPLGVVLGAGGGALYWFARGRKGGTR